MFAVCLLSQQLSTQVSAGPFTRTLTARKGKHEYSEARQALHWLISWLENLILWILQCKPQICKFFYKIDEEHFLKYSPEVKTLFFLPSWLSTKHLIQGKLPAVWLLSEQSVQRRDHQHSSMETWTTTTKSRHESTGTKANNFIIKILERKTKIKLVNKREFL